MFWLGSVAGPHAQRLWQFLNSLNSLNFLPIPRIPFPVVRGVEGRFKPRLSPRAPPNTSHYVRDRLACRVLWPRQCTSERTAPSQAMTDSPAAGSPPPSPVSELLGPFLMQYSSVFKEAGYDDPSDFPRIDDDELGDLMTFLEKKEVPQGHRRKIHRLIFTLRQLDGAGTPLGVDRPGPLRTPTPLHTPTPLRTPTPSSDELIRAGAALVGAAEVTKTSSAHRAKVEAFLAECSGRVVFGRGPGKATLELTPWQEKVALASTEPLHPSTPSLPYHLAH